jgi:hypothetical protein
MALPFYRQEKRIKHLFYRTSEGRYTSAGLISFNRLGALGFAAPARPSRFPACDKKVVLCHFAELKQRSAKNYGRMGYAMPLLCYIWILETRGDGKIDWYKSCTRCDISRLRPARNDAYA